MAFNDSPEYFRMRAAEMRGRAATAQLAATKEGLARIASDFDLLATRCEQRLARLANSPSLEEGSDEAQPADALLPADRHRASVTTD